METYLLLCGKGKQSAVLGRHLDVGPEVLCERPTHSSWMKRMKGQKTAVHHKSCTMTCIQKLEQASWTEESVAALHDQDDGRSTAEAETLPC